jgi:hypothetical protein
MSEPKISKWVHGDELMKKWKVDEYDLWMLCQEEELFLYSPDTFEKMGIISNTGLLRHVHGSLKNCLNHYWFSSEDIERIEEARREQKAKVPVKKFRPNQRHKEAVIAVAKKLWKTNPKITIEEMAYNDEINRVCEGRVYTPKTIRNWIKVDCPNRKSGRRAKANNSGK